MQLINTYIIQNVNNPLIYVRGCILKKKLKERMTEDLYLSEPRHAQRAPSTGLYE